MNYLSTQTHCMTINQFMKVFWMDMESRKTNKNATNLIVEMLKVVEEQMSAVFA